MAQLKKCFMVLFLTIFAMSFFPQDSHAQRGHRSWQRKPRYEHERPVTILKSRGKYVYRKEDAKRFRFLKKYDLNKDGKVDVKDRLLWAKEHKNEPVTIAIDSDNKDMYEVMDLDNDGVVTGRELKELYSTYDVNRNGVLEDTEIEAASEQNIK